MLCKDCKYWNTTDRYPVDEINNLGKCKKVKMFWDCTEWIDKGDDFVREFKEEYKEEKAFAQDGSDYAAYLITKNDFGCNQFMKKTVLKFGRTDN